MMMSCAPAMEENLSSLRSVSNMEAISMAGLPLMEAATFAEFVDAIKSMITKVLSAITAHVSDELIVSLAVETWLQLSLSSLYGDF